MKKVRLDLDRLVVESFEAAPSLADRHGTVRGYTGPGSCFPCTDWESCPESCDESCRC